MSEKLLAELAERHRLFEQSKRAHKHAIANLSHGHLIWNAISDHFSGEVNMAVYTLSLRARMKELAEEYTAGENAKGA